MRALSMPVVKRSFEEIIKKRLWFSAKYIIGIFGILNKLVYTLIRFRKK